MSSQSRSLEALETRTCFAATGVTPPPPPPPITTLADLNADGKADLITLYAEARSTTSTTPTPPTWELKTQIGKGDGTFAAAKEFDVPTKCPVSLAVGDLDGDGKAEIVILNRDPAPAATSTAPAAPHTSLFILKTDGKGAVLPPPTAAAAPKPIPLPDGLDASSVAISDLNKDALPDLVAIGVLAPKLGTTAKPVVNVATLLNTKTAKGTFQKPTLTATDADPGPYKLSPAGDLDKNGSPDLVAFQVAPPPAAPAPVVTANPKNLALLFSNGDGTLKSKSQANPLLPPPAANAAPPQIRTLGVTDIDADGTPDLIGASANAILVSKFDLKTLSFLPAKSATSTNLPATLSTSQLLLGDVSGDGKSDLLAASDKSVFFGLNTSKPNAPAFSWTPIAPPK